MPVSRAIQQEAGDYWKVVAAAQGTKTLRHVEVMPAPKGAQGLYKISTDYEAINSCAPGNEVVDTAANVFMMLIFLCEDLTKAEEPRKVGTVYTHFFHSPGEGSLTSGYNTDTIANRYLPHIEGRFPGKGLFDLDMLIVPIHTPGHWRLGIVDFAHTRFEL